MLLQAKADVEREQKLKQGELAVHEKRILQREEHLERKIAAVERRDAEAQRREALLAKREEAVAGTEAASERLLKERQQSLERVASLTAEEAKRQLIPGNGKPGAPGSRRSCEAHAGRGKGKCRSRSARDHYLFHPARDARLCERSDDFGRARSRMTR